MAGVDVGGFGVLSWSYQIEFRSSTLETALIPQITSTHGSAKSLLPGPRERELFKNWDGLGICTASKAEQSDCPECASLGGDRGQRGSQDDRL